MGTARISVRAFAGACAAAVVVSCSTAKVGGITTETMQAMPDDAGTTTAVAPAPDAAAPPAAAPAKDAAVDAPPPGECASETAQAACITCCSNAHMDGSTVYFVALIDCMCLDTNCARECATTLCDPQNPKNGDASCQACIQAKNSACVPSIQSACTADTDCTLFDACVGKSDCAGKSK